MPILEQLFGGGVGKLVKDVVGTFKLSPEAKLEFDAKMEANQQAIRLKEYELEEKAMEATQSIVDAQKSVIVAEMGQGDNYTKRARPTLVYAGLGFIFLNHVFCPMFAFFTGRAIPNMNLPGEFWTAWSAVVGIWSIGRTFERRGNTTKTVKAITG